MSSGLVSVLRRAALALALVLTTSAVAERPARAEANVSVDLFVSTLSPYGEWVEVAEVGRVWRPHARVVGERFVPYGSGGHWVLTDHGWVFETDWAWGWAPFHYGRWFLDARYGWVWLPDTTWGPAWVDWRWGGGYVGWVPLAPARVRVVRETDWIFVEHRHFVERDVWVRRLPVERVHVAYGASARIEERVTIGGRSWVRGPDPVHIEAAVHQPLVRQRLIAPEAGRLAAHRLEAATVERAAERKVEAREAPSAATKAQPLREAHEAAEAQGEREGRDRGEAHEKRHHEGGMKHEKERKKGRRH